MSEVPLPEVLCDEPPLMLSLSPSLPFFSHSLSDALALALSHTRARALSLSTHSLILFLALSLPLSLSHTRQEVLCDGPVALVLRKPYRASRCAWSSLHYP
jgi:hypothetical protein